MQQCYNGPVIAEFLTSIGLNSKEIALYLALQKYGTQPTSLLGKKAGMNRGTAYLTLHDLLKKGLVSKTVKSQVQYFTASDPARILDYISNKQSELQKQKDQADAVLQQLSLLHHPFSTRPSMEYFEGVEGAKSAMLQTLKAKNKTICAFTSLKDLVEFLGTDFLDEYTKRRVRSGCALKIIRTRKVYGQAVKKLPKGNHYETNAKEKREVRFIPDTMAFPVSMYLFDDHIVIISSNREHFALVITSAETAGMQKKLFALLWEILAKE